MNDKLSEVQSYITSLWSSHLNANDFKETLEKYLNKHKDWHKTSLNISDNNLHIKLYIDEENGYDFTVKMSKK
jgi:hypothetical protein